MDRELDVLSNYRAINNKLKKRLLKKPNFAEASDQFGTLTRVLKQQECLQYAGFCCIAKAHCQNALNNPVAETEALVEAARLFFKAEKENVDVKCPAFEEHLTEATHCFNQAIKIYKREGHLALAAMISLEVGNKLREVGKIQEACDHFIRAAEIQRSYSIIDYLHSTREGITCRIMTGDYHSALKMLSELSTIIEAYEKKEPFILVSQREFICSCEIDKVFLLLLLQSSPQQLSSAYGKVMEKYIWENLEDSRPAWLQEELFQLLQSLIMAVQEKDTELLKELENDLFPFLKGWQCQIYFDLINSLNQVD
ncbi:40-kDa huntingtin-associated protein-like [Rhopilema esculentum]|uniref:40-kDa huntingtin-associated protein-like n=1 Tax=Rhopilema esculentum TaxID=499914 RepID=UPI0031DE0D61|eukprot:gene1087-15421_t